MTCMIDRRAENNLEPWPRDERAAHEVGRRPSAPVPSPPPETNAPCVHEAHGQLYISIVWLVQLD